MPQNNWSKSHAIINVSFFVNIPKISTFCLLDIRRDILSPESEIGIYPKRNSFLSTFLQRTRLRTKHRFPLPALVCCCRDFFFRNFAHGSFWDPPLIHVFENKRNNGGG